MPLDAIVVPAGRPAANLDSAFRLGADLDVQIVVLCSKDAKQDEVLDAADRVAGVRCTAVDLPNSLGSAVLPRLETARFPRARISWHGDLSLKRNLGLVMGRLCGWRTVLFLDDDIRGLDPTLVRDAVGTLRYHAAAGMPATVQPDNSVVGHARRLAFGDQGVFVSGSALAVGLARVESFFPPIYNEDWLFLAPYVDHREVARAGRVRQDWHHLYDLDRAGEEEFGDVVGEGLIGRLHTGGLQATFIPGYWAEFLQHRATFIKQARDACQESAHPDAPRAVLALDRAEEVRARLAPDELAQYVTAWWADRLTWRRYISGIPRRDDLPSALAHLGLSADSVRSRPARKTGSG